MKTPILSQGDIRFKKSSHRKLGKSVFTTLVAGCLLSLTSSLQAAPFIDNLEDISHVLSSVGSATFNLSDGILTVTPTEVSPGVWGVYGGLAVFRWSLDGGVYSGFSLKPEDEQYIFSMSGVRNVTPEGSNDAFLYSYIYFTGGPILDRETFLIPDNLMRPVNGEWSYNILQAAQLHFGGEVPEGVVWTFEIYIAAGGQQGVGYQFDSFAAIPEPGTAALALVAGGMGLCCYGLARPRRTL